MTQTDELYYKNKIRECQETIRMLCMNRTGELSDKELAAVSKALGYGVPTLEALQLVLERLKTPEWQLAINDMRLGE